jgi:hypothetical protein
MVEKFHGIFMHLADSKDSKPVPSGGSTGSGSCGSFSFITSCEQLASSCRQQQQH